MAQRTECLGRSVGVRRWTSHSQSARGKLIVGPPNVIRGRRGVPPGIRAVEAPARCGTFGKPRRLEAGAAGTPWASPGRDSPIIRPWRRVGTAGWSSSSWAMTVRLWHAWEVAVGGGWSGWVSFGNAGVGFQDHPALAASADGRLELFRHWQRRQPLARLANSSE